MRIPLFALSMVTFGMALWLASAVVFILPSRDPGHATMWAIVAACFAGYSVLSWLYLQSDARAVALRAALRALSVVAVVLGGWAVVDTARKGASGGHFEGYLVLMGAMIALHGLIALLCAPRPAAMKGV